MVVDISRWPRSLDRPDVVTALQQVGGEGMAEGVATGALVDAGRADGAGPGALHVRFVVVMPPLGRLALPTRRRGENPLPAPVARRRRELSVDRVRQPDTAESRGQVFLVQRSRAYELFA